jgi:hypothetical protein
MKKKIIISAVVLFAASLIFSLLFYDTFNKVEVTADTLSKEYLSDKTKADEIYLDKIIEVKGTVKAYYTLLQISKVLELNTKYQKLPVICFFLDQVNQSKAGNLREGQTVIITGKCVGTDSYSFVKGVKLNVKDIDLQ